MSGASSTGGRESDARAPTPRMTGVPPSDPAAINSYLLGVAAAASSYNPLLLNRQSHPNPNAQLIQLAALQHWQAAQSAQLLPALSAQLNPQTLTALYYNQLLSSFPTHQTPSPDPHTPVSRQPSLPPPPPARPTPTMPHHPALTRIASEGPRRKSAPVIPATTADWAHSHALSDDAGPSSAKPVLSSPKAIQEHIDALISENEAIVLPQAPLLQKRRTYQRHTIAETKPYPSLSSPPKKQNAGRSASLVESQLSPNIALHAQRQAHLSQYHRGSLPANVPMFTEQTSPVSNTLVLGGPQIPTTHVPHVPRSAGFKCQHCALDFPSDKALQAHVFRCSLNMTAANPPRTELPALVPTSVLSAVPRQPLTGALSLDPNLLLQLQQQQQLLRAQTELLAAAKQAPSPSSSTQVPKSQHPLKKRILAEHMLETSTPQPTPSQPPVKVAKLETAEKAVGGSVDVRRPVAVPAAALPRKLEVPVPAAALLSAHAIALSVTLSAEEKAQKFSPYTRTVEVEGSERSEAPKSGRRPRHVTAPTFVCMKRPQPFFLLHTDPKRSMYSSWQQVHVNPVEAKLNLLWMGGCCTRPRKGSHPYWKYTMADKELGVSRMTHSTFASYSTKLRASQEAEVEAVDGCTPVKLGTVKEEPRTPSSKDVLWQRALDHSAQRHRRRLSSAHKRHLSVESNWLEKSEDSVASGRLEIGSPVTSDTEDACEIEDEERNGALSGTRAPAGKEKPPLPPVCRTRYVGAESSARTPPLEESEAAVSARLERDCESVPAIGVSWPSPPPPVTSAPPLFSPTALLRSPVRNGAVLPSNPLAATSLSPYLVSAASLECTICDKRFAKPDQLRLHMDIHVYQEGARKKSYACPVCAHAHTTKAALHKHIQANHPGEALPVDPAPKDDHDSKGNPRPFKCTDCDTAFRGQGFLQKHLRSKLHVMKLECTGKLPFGTYALFEAANFNLGEVDTTDCEAALLSMRRHAAILQPNFPTLNATKDPTKEHAEQQPATSAETTPVKASLLCTETAPPASPSPRPVSPEPQVSEPETPTKPLPTTSESSGKCVTADVWVPPKEDEIIKTLPQALTLPKCAEKTKVVSAGEESEESQNSFRDQEPLTNGVDACEKKEGRPEEESGEKPSTPQIHICHFCKLQAVSGTDLEVHLHSDHIAIRDGNDFRCPRPNCDKIYPSRESLRLHIAAHYLGGGSAPHGLNTGSERDGDVSRETMAALQRKLGAGGAPGPTSAVPPAGTVGNQSPGTPEESQTSFAAVTGGRKKMKTHLVALNSIPEAAPSGSPLSEAASEASSPSPHPQPKATKRRSLEDQFPSPLGKRDALSGRRCTSALENNPNQNNASSAFTSPLQLGSPSYSLPAVPAQITQHAPLSWFGNGLFNTPFALLQQASNLASLAAISSAGNRESSPPATEAVAATTTLHCPLCQVPVPDVEGLQRHLVSHVSSRPHICPECDAGFTTHAALAAHAASHQAPLKSEESS